VRRTRDRCEVGPQSTRHAGCPRSTGRRSRPSLHCHLRWWVSLPRDFPLEPFAGRLPSDDANQRAQRLFAVIPQRSSWRSASRSLRALFSRPNHNAATPSRVNLCDPAAYIGGLPGGHHAICRERGAAAALSSPKPRQGTKRSEWLDWAADRRTISRRDGRSAYDQSRTPRNSQGVRDAQVEERQEAAIENRSRCDSERVRAQLTEGVFPAKPDRCVDSDSAAEIRGCNTRPRARRMKAIVGSSTGRMRHASGA
jgi:hypothetical protein